ncbi:Uncharacterised protein [Chryseobacterium gleum]|uniref:Uncharacterized protein n=2 Tax=Chryseobacterium gleum TaxID=250 RepID=A0A3S4R2Q5_CHRGE|nr:hypothetical protein [Chryseobacterium gleum]EFK36359.1 hypothetical protein HMPREF0204_11806 [Chryseobacterium gleum ATCC 35910]QQY33600.1 hypothetical protein I6I60_07490 [Chryseobacterium gleum]VEE08420.1 Uncharacterised protein [Chryseobacterium gleum]
MKYFKILFLLIIIFAGILISTKLKLTIESAEYNTNYKNIYPPNCFIKFENKKYLIKQIYKYKYKILCEYWVVASEGFAVQKFEFPFEMNYNNDQKKSFLLKYSENKEFIKFNSRKYKITEKRNDTIISKTADNKLIVFINE